MSTQNKNFSPQHHVRICKSFENNKMFIKPLQFYYIVDANNIPTVDKNIERSSYWDKDNCCISNFKRGVVPTYDNVQLLKQRLNPCK